MRIFFVVSALILLVSCYSFAKQEQPNILLIIADDCTFSDLEIYGGQAKTPHLRKLVSEGMIFSHCYQAAPMCSPTRHCLYTGLYPVKSGAYPNHTKAFPWVKSIAHYLQSSGYTTHLSGKTHIAPKSVFPFQYSGVDNNPDPTVFSKVVQSSAKSGKPFLFIAASNEPHTPWNRGDPSAYPPNSLKLPPVLVDSPKTRDGYSNYLAEITYFDSQVGELLDMLDKSSLRDNTLVIVLSEQGNSLPFAKWTCYDAGLHSGCVNDGRYRYIRNLSPDEVFENIMMKDPIFKEWQKMAKDGNANAKRLVHDYRHRPAEELYDTISDPWNRKNLIADESLSEICDGLRSALDNWMKQQGDEGTATEMKAFERMPRMKKK